MSRKKPEREKKRELRAAAEAAEVTQEKDSGWEWKSVKFAIRAMGVFFFVGYVFMTMPGAGKWAQAKWELHYPISSLPARADYYLNKSFQPEKLYKAISMRPASETDKIIAMLEPYTARMSTYTFLLYSLHKKGEADTLAAEGREAKAQGNEKEATAKEQEARAKTDDALFWWQFARYRARFDALRCGSVSSVDTLNDLLKIIPHPDFPADELHDEMTVVKSIRKVLELDAHFPADNIPEDMCDPLRSLESGNYRSVGYDRWRDIRYSLRLMTEYRLTQMEDELKKGKRKLLDDKEPSFDDYMRQLDSPLKKKLRAIVGDKDVEPALNEASCKKLHGECQAALDKCKSGKNADCSKQVMACEKMDSDCKKITDTEEKK